MDDSDSLQPSMLIGTPAELTTPIVVAPMPRCLMSTKAALRTDAGGLRLAPRECLRTPKISFACLGTLNRYHLCVGATLVALGKFARAMHEFAVCITSNTGSLINYGERYGARERISSCLTYPR
jgi:hypothetical protein